MSYTALARKWRPKNFGELTGQEHVLRALSNALTSGRVHHAFLFTGTRGVGKTTIARILAKCLNCETGPTATPCGSCAACREIDEGRFIDLIEVDAASRTKVDDTRELLDNVQYAPSRGRYKVYLIDEVHMLSAHSFNALLKTLEEPPPHVKFLLATTDPQRLPVTVLSRCQQFNLQRLPVVLIAERLKHILAAEGVAFDAAAVRLVAIAADGSMRDGLSLLDQLIAFGNGKVEEAAARAMLGTIDRQQVARLVELLADGDAAVLLEYLQSLEQWSPDHGQLLDAVAALLARIALKQAVPDYQGDELHDAERLAALATRLSPEDVQLHYQTAILGRRDLQWAPDPRTGFEMTLLRMLAFRPDAAAQLAPARAQPVQAAAPDASRQARSDAAARARAALADSLPMGARQAPAVESPPQSAPMPPPPVPVPAPAAPVAPAVAPAPVVPPAPASTSALLVTDSEHWLELVAGCGLRGPAKLLAENAGFVGHADGVLRLSLAPEQEHLKSPSLVLQLCEAIGRQLGGEVQVRFEIGQPRGETANARNARERDARQAGAESGFVADPGIQRLVQQFGAQIVPDSVRPLDAN